MSVGGGWCWGRTPGRWGMAGSVWWPRRRGSRRTPSRAGLPNWIWENRRPAVRARRARAAAGEGPAPGQRAAGAGRARPARGPGVPAAVDGEIDPRAGSRADPAGAPGRTGHRGPAAQAGKVSPCRARPVRPRAAAIPTGTASSAISTTGCASSPRLGSRWSAWTPRRRKSSATMRSPAGNGTAPTSRCRYELMTFPRRTRGKRCPTASTTWPPTPAGYRWAATGTPPCSRWQPCAAGGKGRASTAIRQRTGC